MRTLAREVDHLLSSKIKVRVGRYLVEILYRQLKDLCVELDICLKNVEIDSW